MGILTKKASFLWKTTPKKRCGKFGATWPLALRIGVKLLFVIYPQISEKVGRKVGRKVGSESQGQPEQIGALNFEPEQKLRKFPNP